MISVADLLTDNRVPGNYYAAKTYVHGDLELGILENRRGDRLIAIPETLIQGIYAGLDKETGQASKLVLFNCGRWWGKNFHKRLSDELSDYYGTTLSDMAMSDFLHCLRQCWITYGWGKIDLDQSYQDRGFLIIQSWNSPFASLAPQMNEPVCYLEAGVLAAVFSQLSGRDLHCIQSTCESMNADCNRFILGVPKRLKPAEALIQNNVPHASIMEQLCA